MIARIAAAEFGLSSRARPAISSSGSISMPTPSRRSILRRRTQLLQTAAVFAIGFLMRPVGGYVFGFVADKYGRKNSMMISVLMMCRHRRAADLSDHRNGGTCVAAARTHRSGAFGRRRVPRAAN
jgi:MFS family permease